MAEEKREGRQDARRAFPGLRGEPPGAQPERAQVEARYLELGWLSSRQLLGSGGCWEADLLEHLLGFGQAVRNLPLVDRPLTKFIWQEVSGSARPPSLFCCAFLNHPRSHRRTP